MGLCRGHTLVEAEKQTHTSIMNRDTHLADPGTMPSWLNADVADTLELLSIELPAVLMKAQAGGDAEVENLLLETTAARTKEFNSILEEMGADDGDMNARLSARETLNSRGVSPFVPERFRAPAA